MVIEADGAAADHFQAGRLGAPIDEIPVQAGFNLPDVTQPVVQGKVLVDTAQQDHGCVGVHVVKARDNSLAAAVLFQGSGNREWLPGNARY